MNGSDARAWGRSLSNVWPADAGHDGRRTLLWAWAARVSDEDIRADVEEALTEDSRLDASDVQVSGENGIVTLRGRVQSREDRRRAEELATMGRACAMCATNSKSKIWPRVEQLTPGWRATAEPVPARYYLA